MKLVDFYSLPRAVQDRLVASFGGEFEPRPIVARRASHPTSFAWLGVAATSLVLFALLWRWGYGDLDSRFSRHGYGLLLAYFGLAAALALGLGRAAAHRLVQRGLPFATGIYLFPANLIDARGRQLRVYSLDALSEVTAAKGRPLVVRFGSARFSFALGAAKCEQVAAQVREAAERTKGPLDDKERQFLDPLVPPAVASPLASDVPFAPARARWLRASWAVAAAVGLLGVPAYYLRDRGSDARMFEVARARDDAATYQRYLERGDAERAQVARVLLPRAALRSAVARGSVEAIDEFVRSYPDTDIRDEVARARRAALEQALGQAKERGSLAALAAFAERYPNHGLDAPLRQAKHAIYQRALEQYRAKVPPKNAQVAAFVERLLATVEKQGTTKTATGVRGPTVEIRLERLPSVGFENADKIVRKSPEYTGPHALPSRYVDPPKVEPYEKELTKALADSFSQQFDPEVVTFSAGPPVDGKTDAPSADRGPSLLVRYRIEPSGANYATRKPRCVLSGLAMVLKSSFTLPGDPKPLNLDHTVVAGVPVRKLQEHKAPSPPGTLETAIYDSMLKTLHEAARDRFLASWFRTTP